MAPGPVTVFVDAGAAGDAEDEDELLDFSKKAPLGATGTTVWVMAAVVVAIGIVTVTTVMVSAHPVVHVVTVVVKPLGQPSALVGQTNGVVVAEAGATGTVVVRVYDRVVKPVGQTSMYDVTQMVVV
jgi:hypothetical protein